MEVVRNVKGNNGEVLEVYGHREGAARYNNGRLCGKECLQKKKEVFIEETKKFDVQHLSKFGTVSPQPPATN